MKGLVGVGLGRTADLLGSAAVVQGAGGPAGLADPLDPARCVRRSLADAGLKAFDVSRLVVTTSLARDETELAAFARRALGPTGEAIVAVLAPADQVIAVALDGAAGRVGVAGQGSGPGQVGAAGRVDAAGRSPVVLAVLHGDGWTFAVCLAA